MTVVLGPEIAGSSVLISGSASAISEVVGQLIETNGDFSSVDWTKVGISTAVGVATKDMGVLNTSIVNTAVEVGDLTLRKDGNSILDTAKKAGETFTATFIGGYFGRKLESGLDKVINPVRNKYKFETIYIPYPIEIQNPNSIVPSVVGNVFDNSLSGYIDYKLGELIDEK